MPGHAIARDQHERQRSTNEQQQGVEPYRAEIFHRGNEIRVRQPCGEESRQGCEPICSELRDPLLLAGKAIQDPIRGYEQLPQYADAFRYRRRDFATEFGPDGHLKRGTSKVVTSDCQGEAADSTRPMGVRPEADAADRLRSSWSKRSGSSSRAPMCMLRSRPREQCRELRARRSSSQWSELRPDLPATRKRRSR